MKNMAPLHVARFGHFMTLAKQRKRKLDRVCHLPRMHGSIHIVASSISF